MTANDICRIIETGGKSGVTSFRYAGLEVRYSSDAPQQSSGPYSPPVLAGMTEPTELTPAQQESIEQHEDDLLAITRPEEYERRIMMDMAEEVIDAISSE